MPLRAYQKDTGNETYFFNENGSTDAVFIWCIGRCGDVYRK